jgi:uncharacterized protein (DUF2141 family)
VKAWLLAVTPLLIGAAGADAPIEVGVTDLRSDKGMVRVSVCPKARFMKDDCPWFASAPARKGGVTVTVTGVPPGQYAVQAFHDEDGNGKLGTNWIGLPKEGVGFSRDAMTRLLPPRFSRAVIDHGTEAQQVPVKIRYFLD